MRTGFASSQASLSVSGDRLWHNWRTAIGLPQAGLATLPLVSRAGSGKEPSGRSSTCRQRLHVPGRRVTPKESGVLRTDPPYR